MTLLATPFVYLFLDFDGVLHRFFPVKGETDAGNAHFAFLPAFEAAVCACDRPVRIVITSTWRNKYSLAELRNRFSPDIAALIVGVTPRVGDGKGAGGRLAEVQQWLADHQIEDAIWVGIDDYPELYRPGVPVVACQDHFTQHEHDLLLEAVRDPQGYAARYPCPDVDDGQIRIVTGVGNRE